MGLAQDFLDPGIGGRFEVNKQNQSGVQYIQNPYVDDNGRTVVKRVGFDFNPDNKHVQNTGFPHLNLQTQFDGKPAGKNSPYHDPHIPVEPTDIKKNDY